MSLKMQEELGDDVTVLFVQSQEATPEQAEKFIYNKRWQNDRSIWTTEQPFSVAIEGLPSGALLGNDGSVLWSGRPTSDHSKVMDLVDEQIKLAKKGAKGMSPTVAKANGEYEKGNIAAALKMLDGAPEAEKADAGKLRHSLETRTKAKVARLDWYIENGDYDKADKLLATLQKGVAGDEKFEASAKTAADKLAAKELAQEREAAKAFAKVQKLMLDGKGGFDDLTVKQLTAVTTKYPKTRAAKRASHLIDLSKVSDS
jgi:hypothetical protein